MSTPDIDPTVVAILKKYQIDSNEALWDLNEKRKGAPKWIMKHRFMERVAAAAKIRFDPPQILTNAPEVGFLHWAAMSRGDQRRNGFGSFAMVVVGRMGTASKEKVEWATGEANPNNCSMAYPWSMAEKRAKDRVVLKLLGLHGFVYSENEAEWERDGEGQGAGQQGGRPAGQQPVANQAQAQQQQHVPDGGQGDIDHALRHVGNPPQSQYPPVDQAMNNYCVALAVEMGEALTVSGPETPCGQDAAGNPLNLGGLDTMLSQLHTYAPEARPGVIEFVRGHLQRLGFQPPEYPQR